MGRSPCCDKVGLKKGPWTPEEDQKLLAYIEEHGHGSWRALPSKAGLQRCGKSCRLRWINYLRPDIKRGKFSLQEEQTIIQLHALLGNRWSAIATHLPKRTDNEIKNYWNTHLKKRLTKMGIDPVTHKSKNDALFISDGQSKSAANLSHIAQWESARLEAEARLVRESRLRSNSNSNNSNSNSNSLIQQLSNNPVKAWNNNVAGGGGGGVLADLESPTSTLTTFSENHSNVARISFIPTTTTGAGENSTTTTTTTQLLPEEYNKEVFENSISFSWTTPESLRPGNNNGGEEGFTSLLLNNIDNRSLTLSDNGGGGDESENGSEYYEDNKNYWNSILNLVNSSPSHSSMF